jgi:predicted flap endonuclease-1-like 5' DNA nuclease
MTTMIQEPNDEPEIEADALIELVDAPARPSHTPPPPPVHRAASEPTMPSMPSAPPVAPGPETQKSSPSTPPSLGSRRLSSLPSAPPRPGTPSVNPITTDRPSTPPRSSSSNLRTPPPVAAASSPLPPPVAERTPLTELEEQLDLVRRTLAVRDAEIRTLLEQRDARVLELDALRHQLSSRELAVKEIEFAALSRDARIRELEKELEAARLKAGNAGDDLKQIKGIGPAFERELKRLGVSSFAQIAAWTPEEVESIAKKIKAKPERIRRDDWIGRAKELAAKTGGA